MLQQTRGIVLRTVRYKDTAFIADVYTELSGRASFMVRMPRSRKALLKPSLFQPMALIELGADCRPTSSIGRVVEARSAWPYASVPFDPAKSAIALFLAECLCRALREESENRPLFDFLFQAMVRLDQCAAGFANFHLAFLMRLSRFLGFSPNLSDYTEGCCFDLQAGCFTPVPPSQHAHYLPPTEAARLSTLMRMNFDTMHRFALSRDERWRCLELLIEYYRLHLPDFPEPKSLEVLRGVFSA